MVTLTGRGVDLRYTITLTPFVGRCFFSFPLCVPLLYEKTDVFVTERQDQRRPREWYKCPGFETAGKMTLFGLGVEPSREKSHQKISSANLKMRNKS